MSVFQEEDSLHWTRIPNSRGQSMLHSTEGQVQCNQKLRIT